MKNIIVKFGSLTGVCIAVFMVFSMQYSYQSGHFEGNMLLGYGAMLVAFSFVFLGIKKYRDQQAERQLSFKTGFKIGILISLLASGFYVVAWAIEYHVFMPDFLEKFTQHQQAELLRKGASAAELASKAAESKSYRDMYANPFYFVLLTFAEIFPVGFFVTMLSALVLKKRAT
jgi:amino acid transporter